MEIPDGSFAIVFESGVFRFDEDGALHVHLSHGREVPHPLHTHPDGEDGAVPPSVSEGLVEGSGEGTLAGMASEAEELPEGLVITIRGFSVCRVESSGDLSALVPEASAWPDWFTPGKIHRFDGPDGRPRIWTESAPPPKRKAAPRERAPAPERLEPKAGDPQALGCLPALIGLILGG